MISPIPLIYIGGELENFTKLCPDMGLFSGEKLQLAKTFHFARADHSLVHTSQGDCLLYLCSFWLSSSISIMCILCLSDPLSKALSPQDFYPFITWSYFFCNLKCIWHVIFQVSAVTIHFFIHELYYLIKNQVCNFMG